MKNFVESIWTFFLYGFVNTRMIFFFLPKQYAAQVFAITWQERGRLWDVIWVLFCYHHSLTSVWPIKFYLLYYSLWGSLSSNSVRIANSELQEIFLNSLLFPIFGINHRRHWVLWHWVNLLYRFNLSTGSHLYKQRICLNEIYQCFLV